MSSRSRWRSLAPSYRLRPEKRKSPFFITIRLTVRPTRTKKDPEGNITLLSELFCSFYMGESVRFSVRNYNIPYFAIEATSAAKSSCFFSMPSPFSKRTHLASLISPPSSFATAAMCCSTETLFSLTKACCRRQFSS